MKTRLCEFFAFSIVALQFGGVLRMPFVEDRFFCWSPHDSRTDYVLTAMHRGETVSEAEIQQRYQLPEVDWHAAGNLKRVIEVAERRRPLSERWHVTMKYRVNLGAEQIWEHPAGQ